MTYPRDKFPFHELSLDDRAMLAQEVWASIEDECSRMEVSDEVRTELNRRLDAFNKNPDDSVTWEELKRQLRELCKRSASEYLASKGGSNSNFRAGRRRRPDPDT